MAESERAQRGERLIPPHGGYRKLQSYRNAEIIYDATVAFCDRFVDRRSRTRDQMVQAARSGKQNIAEGSQVSGTSRRSEFKLVGVARGSLEELLIDYQDFLRGRSLPLWGKDDPRALEVRQLAYVQDRSYRTYRTYVEQSSPDTAANAMVCLIHQTNYLLDHQLRELESRFLAEGGFSERLFRMRSARRGRDRGRPRS
jgi:four helix bundle suffix protein